MKKRELINFTYDPDLEPFYVSKQKFDEKLVQLYDLDCHCNNFLLVRNHIIIEFYNDKYECIIIPKLIAEKLRFDNDNILDVYFKTQKNARAMIERQNATLSIITVIFIVSMVLTLFNILVLNPILLAIPYALLVAYFTFRLKNKQIQNAFKNYIYALNSKYGKDEVQQNLTDICEHIKNIEYLDNKQKLRYIKHFEKLKVIK